MMRHAPARALPLACWLLAVVCLASAQTPTSNLAPGAPGADAQWANAGKTAVGTSNTAESKVWFTLRGGALTEVYYPTVDVANVRTLHFVVVSADGRLVETEEADALHQTEAIDPQALSFRQVNTARSGAWKILKTYTTDPARATVLIDVEFQARGAQRLYVYYDPSLNNSGMHDSAWTEANALLAADADKASALVSSTGFTEMTNGFSESESDGLRVLRERGGVARAYTRAADGNVVQFARVVLPPASRGRESFTLALSFGREPREALQNARESLAKGFAAARAGYEQGWHEYVRTLRRVAPQYQRQYDMAAMVLKAHEDKTFRGAMIASLSVPWGGGPNANEPNVGGYHLVWSRDLYQVATAFYALGDKASADRALNYLFTVQQKADGSFPQNSWLDGRPFWGSLQLDEVSYPLILAYQLGRTDNETWTKHVRPAANFIIRHGPYTPQERWEEESGYSPSTIAAEIAGLVCAAEIARRNDDPASAALYLAAADDWARNVERWTGTTTGTYADKNYYLRVTENDDPDDGEPRELNNGAGTFDERQVVDAGFLELVRLGVKSPQDPLVVKSVAVIDRTIKVETPNGPSFYRYNHDGYGEMDDGRPWNFDGRYTGKGRLWALLAGERGEYELARGQKDEARKRLDAMQGFANEGLMIPEQVWDRRESPRPDLVFGEGTGSATPLAWSMAQFIRLATSIEEGRNVSLPDIVAARYARQPAPPADARAASESDSTRTMEAGSTFPLRFGLPPNTPPGTRLYVFFDGQARELPLDKEGQAAFDFPVAAGDNFGALAVVSPTGATSFQRLRVRGVTAEEAAREQRAEETAEFVEMIKSAKVSPVVVGERATFVYRGAAKRVEMVGDSTGWSPRGNFMRGLPGTDIRYVTYTFPRAARVEYKLVADGEWILDPLNPVKLDNGVGGENSVLTMPDYRPSPQANDIREGMSFRLETAEVPSRRLNGPRKIQVFIPLAYDADKSARLPVLYVQDGSDYLRRAHAARIAANLIDDRKVAPFIIVFVDPANRMSDYWADDRFADFMATELVPYIDGRYRTRADRDARALLGASLGGTISVWTALRHPEAFARVGGQSTAFQIDDERVVTALARLGPPDPARPFRFYLDVGRLEALLRVNRRAHAMLVAKGYPVTYRESDAGHNYTNWRDQLADAFTALWDR